MPYQSYVQTVAESQILIIQVRRLSAFIHNGTQFGFSRGLNSLHSLPLAQVTFECTKFVRINYMNTQCIARGSASHVSSQALFFALETIKDVALFMARWFVLWCPQTMRHSVGQVNKISNLCAIQCRFKNNEKVFQIYNN